MFLVVELVGSVRRYQRPPFVQDGDDSFNFKTRKVPPGIHFRLAVLPPSGRYLSDFSDKIRYNCFWSTPAKPILLNRAFNSFLRQ
jgi:hypothetical protein